MSKGTILVIDDEKDLIELVRYNLEKEGYDVIAATDGQTGLDVATKHRPDLVVLDLMMPGIDGLQVCQKLRADQKVGRTPVIMLTAKATEADRIVGLELGADDYITKPFSPSELIARVRAVIRRSKPDTTGETLVFADISMDLAAHRVVRGGKPVHLGPTEFRLLRFLMEHPGRVYSREQLLDAVWGHDVYVEVRTVDVHIRRLRKALNGSDTQDVIRTVRSAGYSLDEGRE